MSTVQHVFIVVLATLWYVSRCEGTCDDLDTQACALMQQKNPSLCQDHLLSGAVCRRFCKLCPLECHHCSDFVQEARACNKTRTCQTGEMGCDAIDKVTFTLVPPHVHSQMCLLLESISTLDQHHGYKMTCASVDVCDGKAPLNFNSGSVAPRDLKRRNLQVSCCSEDRCNTPTYNVLTTPAHVNHMTQTTPSHINHMTQSTAHSTLPLHECDTQSDCEHQVCRTIWRCLENTCSCGWWGGIFG